MSNLSLINSAKLSSFEKAVYCALLAVPRGRVISYGALAKKAGFPGAARAVGQALHKNPFAPRVPCHRVVKSSGALGGFAWGTKQKTKLLAKEGVIVRKGKIIDFKKIKTC